MFLGADKPTTDSTRVEVRTRIGRIPDTVFFEIPVEDDTKNHLKSSKIYTITLIY